MKRNLSLLLVVGCFAGAGWGSEIIDRMIAMEDVDQDIKLKSAVVKELPSGVRIVETPAYNPVGKLPVRREASQKGYTLDSLISVKPDGSFYSKQIFNYSPAGKVTEQRDYLYDAATQSWKISNHYVYTWYDNGYLKSDEQITSKGSAIKNEYKYNEQNLGIEKITLRRADANSEYVNYRKGEYDYDERGNMIIEDISAWTNGEWVLNSKTDASYDENNYRKTIEIWKLKNGVLIGTDKQDTEYNKAGLNTLLISYSWERKEGRKFDPFARMTNIFMKDTIAVTQDIDYYNLDDNAWTGNFKDRNGAERYNIHASKEFDDRDRVTLSFSEKLIGDEWFRGSNSDYVYTDNADGSYTCVKTNKLRSVENPEYRTNEIVTTKVDAQGRTVYYFDDFLANKKLSSEWTDTYDSKGNNLGREEFKYDANGNRYNYIKSENTYDEWGNIIETYNWKGEAVNSDIKDTWVYSSRFTYNYEMDGTVRTDKRRYKYVADTDSWVNDFGDGADFDFSVPVSDIVVPTGYNAEYMQTAKYNYKGNGDGWDTTKFTYYYTHDKETGVNDIVSKDSTLTFSNNTLHVNGGTIIDNTVYTTDGMIVYNGHNAEEDLSDLGAGLYIIKSIVDGKTTTLKVMVR